MEASKAEAGREAGRSGPGRAGEASVPNTNPPCHRRCRRGWSRHGPQTPPSHRLQRLAKVVSKTQALKIKQQQWQAAAAAAAAEAAAVAVTPAAASGATCCIRICIRMRASGCFRHEFCLRGVVSRFVSRGEPMTGEGPHRRCSTHSDGSAHAAPGHVPRCAWGQRGSTRHSVQQRRWSSPARGARNCATGLRPWLQVCVGIWAHKLAAACSREHRLLAPVSALCRAASGRPQHAQQQQPHLS